MFFLTLSNMWNLLIFFPLTYIIFLISYILYSLPLLYNLNIKNNFFLSPVNEVINIIFLPIISIFIIFNLWSSFSISLWFGHIVYTCFQFKITILILFFFTLFNFLYSCVSYLSSREIFDFLIVQFNFLYWTILFFYANSFLTVIFIIEILSTLVFLLISTSIFSSCFFYKNIDFSLNSFFENSTPYTFIQSILFFFWISLISSLNLFLFLILFYDKMFSFDWYLIEHIFLFVINVSSYKEIYTVGIIWFIILFSIFLKCGIAPFYLWKPTFFKGMSFSFVSFYISFFYFFLFLFIIHFISSYCHELFYFFTFFSLILIFTGLFTLFFILCETFYIKTFLAVSSILNSLLVFLCITACHSTDFFLIF